MWFLQHLKQLGIYLHVFVPTQGSKVVSQGVLTEDSEEKDAEVHEQVEKCGGRVNFQHIFNIFRKLSMCLLYLRIY